MKKILAFIISAMMLLSLCACGEDAKAQVEDAKAQADSKESNTGKVAVWILESAVWRCDGEALSINIEYDASNNIKKAGVVIEGIEFGSQFNFDDQGRILTEVGYGESNANCEYDYDDSGRISRTRREDSESVYTYDEKGNLIKEVQTVYSDIGAERGFETEITYSYDANGNLIQKVDCGDTCTYEYDAQGRLTVEKWVSDSVQKRVDRTYNENGLLSGAVEIYNEQDESNRYELYYKQIFVDAGQSEVLEAQREYIKEWILMLH